MKKILFLFLALFCCTSLFGCGNNQSVVRIHIRANSNSSVDQEVKLVVRDNVIDYITPLIAECKDSFEVKNVLENNLNSIENIADDVLIENGFGYKSTARLCNEYFPTRQYDGVSFPADYYDALIIELGSGTGDNWWCVAYPPLCFVGEQGGEIGVQYKSKILELINKYLG